MKTCPWCGVPDARRIEFGYPGQKMMEAEERGEIVLGGCLAPPRELGVWRLCMSCNRTFSEETGQSIEDAYEEYMASLNQPK
jgi:hypothetical protein